MGAAILFSGHPYIWARYCEPIMQWCQRRGLRPPLFREGGQGGSCPPLFREGGQNPLTFRAFLTSHAMNRFINASNEAIHLPVVQKPVAACESFTTRNWYTSCNSILRCSATCARIWPFSGTKSWILIRFPQCTLCTCHFCPLNFNLLPTPL